MMRPGGPGDGSPSIERLHELRLRALLHDLVNDLGPGKAAEQFGVDRKTLWRWQRAVELPPRLAETLERMLLERAVSAAGQDRERVRALEERVAGLEQQLALASAGSSGNGGDVDNAVIDVLRQEFTQEIQRLERRLEARQGAVPETGSSGSRTGRTRSQRVTPTWSRGSLPTTMRTCTAWPGSWLTSGGRCGTRIHPRAEGWPGCQGGSGFWSWKWQCWRSTG